MNLRGLLNQVAAGLGGANQAAMMAGPGMMGCNPCSPQTMMNNMRNTMMNVAQNSMQNMNQPGNQMMRNKSKVWAKF